MAKESYSIKPGRKKRRTKHPMKIPLFILALLVGAALCVALLLELTGVIHIFGEADETTALGGQDATVSDTLGKLEIHMIDVGQGDSILVKAPAGNLLFDAGPNNDATERALKTYLDSQNITRLDYVIFTHPDADHIGSGDMIINTYSVGKVLMEPYTYSTVTQVYSELDTAIKAKNIPVEDPYPGETFSVGELNIKILGPVNDYRDKNENSIVMRLDYGESSIMMTGDAETKSEKDIISNFGAAALDCDVLKVGHHGSDTSTSDGFLAAVSPQIALISSNPKGNNFGHPKPVTISKLQSANAEIYRTDTLGDIVLTTDGVTIKVRGSNSQG